MFGGIIMNDEFTSFLEEKQKLIKESIYLIAKLDKEWNREDFDRLKEVNALLKDVYADHRLGPLG